MNISYEELKTEHIAAVVDGAILAQLSADPIAAITLNSKEIEKKFFVPAKTMLRLFSHYDGGLLQKVLEDMYFRRDSTILSRWIDTSGIETNADFDTYKLSPEAKLYLRPKRYLYHQECIIKDIISVHELKTAPHLSEYLTEQGVSQKQQNEILKIYKNYLDGKTKIKNLEK